LQAVRDAFDVACTGTIAAVRRRLGRTGREALTGSPERLVMTRRGSVAVANTGGTLPPLLLIHGNSSCKEVFTHQFKALRDRYRVIAFDLPGHGVSANGDPEEHYSVEAFTDVAEDVLNASGARDPFVFGWSLGGYVAIELAARGTPVRALAIAGTPPLAVVPDDVGRAYDATSHFALASKQLLSGSEARAFASSTTGPKKPDTAFLHSAVQRTDGRARAYTLGKLQIVDWPRQMRFLRAGTVPLAILNGSNDPFLNHAYFGELMLGQLWRGQPQDIADGFHAPFFLRPNDFNATLACFLGGVMAASTDATSTRASDDDAPLRPQPAEA